MKEKLLVEVWELQLGHSLHIESKVRAIKWLKQPKKLVSRWKLLRFDTGTALASLITVAGADTDDASTRKNLRANRPFFSFSMLYFSLFSHAQIIIKRCYLVQFHKRHICEKFSDLRFFRKCIQIMTTIWRQSRRIPINTLLTNVHSTNGALV